MIEDFRVAESARRSGGWWLGVLVLLAAFAALGLLSWRRGVGFRFRDAAEIPIEVYFRLKSSGGIHEVWIQGDDLYAEVPTGYVAGGKAYAHLHTLVPPAFLIDPRGCATLSSSIEPSRFTYLSRRRSWGCD